MRFKNILLCLGCVLLLTGCSQHSKVEDSNHLDAPTHTDPVVEEEPGDQQTPDIEEGPDVQESPDEVDQSLDTILLPVSLKAQETNYYCAVACLQMVLDYHGIQESQSALAQSLKTDPVTGTEYEDLAREASLRIFGNWPLDNSEPGYRYLLWNRNVATDQDRAEFEQRVQTDLKSGDPVFISINPGLVYEDVADAVHEVVLYGADYGKDGNAIRYYCLDPYQNYWNSEEEGRKVFTADELWKAMNDNPEPGYVW